MASLRLRGDAWRVIFRYQKQQFFYLVGAVDEIEARQWKVKVEFLLMRIKQKLIDVPPGVDIITFIKHDGKPPTGAEPERKETTLAQLRESYLKTFGNGAVEENTLYTAKIHLSHLQTTSASTSS